MEWKEMRWLEAMTFVFVSMHKILSNMEGSIAYFLRSLSLSVLLPLRKERCGGLAHARVGWRIKIINFNWRTSIKHIEKYSHLKDDFNWRTETSCYIKLHYCNRKIAFGSTDHTTKWALYDLTLSSHKNLVLSLFQSALLINTIINFMILSTKIALTN